MRTMNPTLKKKIILAGGSGFLGQALARHFSALSWEVVVLTRQPKPRADGLREAAWDGETVGAWARELEGADAVVNLCGKSVDCRYTEENRKLLISSRTLPTRAIGQAISNCQSPPRVWLNSSSASLYKHTFDTAMDENGPKARRARRRMNSLSRSFGNGNRRLTRLRHSAHARLPYARPWCSG
jgi:NAD dependent epimerase/dehydratase family enzyme